MGVVDADPMVLMVGGLLAFGLICLIVYVVADKMEKFADEMTNRDRKIEMAQQDRVMREKELEKQKEGPVLLDEERQKSAPISDASERVYCPHCGKYIGYGDRDFCTYCGKKLNDKML